MEKSQLISNLYKEAVQGIDEQLLLDSEKWKLHILGLPEHLRVVYLVAVLNMQVMNGGFSQYFSNRYGKLFAEETISILTKIGAHLTASYLQSALLKVKENAYNLDNNEIDTFLDNLDAKYYEEDEEKEGGENLTDLIYLYLQKTKNISN